MIVLNLGPRGKNSPVRPSSYGTSGPDQSLCWSWTRARRTSPHSASSSPPCQTPCSTSPLPFWLTFACSGSGRPLLTNHLANNLSKNGFAHGLSQDSLRQRSLKAGWDRLANQQDQRGRWKADSINIYLTATSLLGTACSWLLLNIPTNLHILFKWSLRHLSQGESVYFRFIPAKTFWMYWMYPIKMHLWVSWPFSRDLLAPQDDLGRLSF